MANNDNIKGSGDILSMPSKDTTIRHGDLVMYDAATHNVLPVTGASDDVLLVGVAGSSSLSPTGFDTNGAATSVQITPISVLTRGVFDFTIAAAQLFIGDKVKIVGPQTVIKCTTNENAIGVVTENTAVAATSVRVKLGGGLTNQNLFIG